MGRAGAFSELEYLVLALVGDGRNSGYQIRKELNRTKGGRWSTESGSVYRVLKRLYKDGQIQELGKAGVPNRERTEYKLTDQGQDALDRWVESMPSRDEFAFLVDPIRTRSYFLTRLSPEGRKEVIESWLKESEKFCESLEKELGDTAFPDRIRNTGYSNLLFLAKARHEWLKSLRNVVMEEIEISARS